MRKIIFSLMIIMFAGLLSVSAQRSKRDPLLLRVGDRNITKSEFEAVYKKNNLDMQVVDPKSVEEYLALYINFNLKVVEAMSLGLDTNPAFLSELKTYREQLARPYFTDEHVAQHLIDEAYQRMMYDIRASHILIAVEQNALPADTMEAYRKITSIRERAMAGESFAELAKAYSDDPSAKDTPASESSPFRPGNAGDLNYFTVFSMVYPFETAAYNTPVGQISKPLRTSYGYHIVQVNDRLPAMGTARVAHIMVMTPPDASEEDLKGYKEKIDNTYAKFLAGEDFESLAMQYSEDQNSAPRGGEMPSFTSPRMVPEFIQVVSTLKEPGDVSAPIQTRFGWHIVKLLSKTPPGSIEEVQADIKQRISRDSRSELSRKAVVERLKKEYKVKKHPKHLEPFYELVNDSVFTASWDYDKTLDLSEVLVTFNKQNHTQRDFAEYVKANQARRAPLSIQVYVTNAFEAFVEKLLLDYEDSQLEAKYPAFRNLMQEYHDGILLFELTDKMVWTKAMNDTLGLHAYYEAHAENYTFDERLDASMYTFKDAENAAVARKYLAEQLAENNDLSSINNTLKSEKGLQFVFRHAKYAKGDHPVIDGLSWHVGLSDVIAHGGEWHIVFAHELLPPQPAKLSEVRGMLISDYQNHLEEEWVKELKNKYDVFVDEKVLKSIRF
jgi:peptidyl-prolyl cis-trans isomerase SurA